MDFQGKIFLKYVCFGVHWGRDSKCGSLSWNFTNHSNSCKGEWIRSI